MRREQELVNLMMKRWSDLWHNGKGAEGLRIHILFDDNLVLEWEKKPPSVILLGLAMDKSLLTSNHYFTFYFPFIFEEHVHVADHLHPCYAVSRGHVQPLLDR